CAVFRPRKSAPSWTALAKKSESQVLYDPLSPAQSTTLPDGIIPSTTHSTSPTGRRSNVGICSQHLILLGACDTPEPSFSWNAAIRSLTVSGDAFGSFM